MAVANRASGAAGRAATESPAAVRALWSGVDAAANPASMLAMLVVLVRTLSPSDYGILVIALAASAISMAVNPAIAATTTKFVSELAGQRRTADRRIAAVITISLAAVAAIDLVLISGTVAFSSTLSTWIFGSAVAGVAQRGNVLLLAMLAVGAQQIDAVFAAAIRGLERFRRQALIEVLMRIALVAAVALAAWCTRSVQAVLVAQVVVCVVAVLVRAIALSRLLPERRLFAQPSRTEANQLFGYGGWMWLTAVAGVAYTGVDRIIVGRTFGPAAAGQYNIYVQITQLIHFLPSSLFAFSFPAFSRMSAQGAAQGAPIRRAYKTYSLVIVATACGIAAVILLFWSRLIRIVTGSVVDDGQFDAAALLALNFVALAATIAPYYLLIALGRSKSVSLIAAASVVVALALMIVLIPSYGLAGAAAARLAYGCGTLAFLVRARSLIR